MKTSSSKLVLGLIPVAGISLAYACTQYTQELPQEVTDTLPYVPYVIFAGAILMGLFFSKHRSALVAILLTVIYGAITTLSLTSIATNEHLLLLCMASLLAPLNIAILTKVQDQQILSSHAFTASSLILVQIIFGYWLIKNYQASLSEWLLYTPESLKEMLFNDLPPVILVFYALSMLWVIWQISKKGSVFEIAFLGALVASLLALNIDANAHQQASAIYMCTAGLILIWGIIHNSYLIAYIDELTELPGRRAMNEEMARLRGNYSIAMLDIDHFKKFNDSYGHDVGDQVLRMVASKIAAVHGGGLPYRYGGEEFAVLFPGKDSKACFPYLSNLRETIDSTKMVLRNHNRPASKPANNPSRKIPWQEVHVTISIGVANNGDTLPSAGEVLKAADEALYRSKEKGRNRISQYET